MPRLSRISTGALLSDLGKSGIPLTKAEQKIAKRMAFMAQKPAAKSSAHEGVVERPMDKQLSKILDRKRASMFERGTSVSRIKKQWEEEETREERGATSVQRTTTPYGNMPLVRMPPEALQQRKPKGDEPPDMAI